MMESHTHVSRIEDLAQQAGRDIFNGFLSGNCPIRLIQYVDNRLEGCFEKEFSHRGLYGFRLTKGGIAAIAYVGKSERGGRLRQHLSSRNKDGTALAPSVKTTHKNILNAITNGYKVEVCLYSDPAYGKASLSCVEIATQRIALEDFKKKFVGYLPWITRI